MPVLSYIAYTACLVYLYLGVYAFRLNPRGETNTVFLLLCLSFASWTFGLSAGYGADTEQAVYRWFQHLSFGWYLFPGLMLHLFFVLTADGRPPWLKPLFYVPGLALLVASVSGPTIVTGFRQVPLGWEIVYNTGSFWYYANIVHYTGVLGVVLGLLARWYLRTESTRQRRQARIILLSFVPAALLSTVTGTLAPLLGVGRLPPLAPVLSVIWMWGIWLAITRHRFLAVSPELAAGQLLSSISDMVVLTGTDERICRTNERLHQVTGFTPQWLFHRSVRSLFPECDGAANGPAAPACRSILKCRTRPSIPVQLSVTPVTDDYGETVGTLYAAQDLRTTQALTQEARRREQAVEALQASEERFRKVFYASPIGLTINRLSDGLYLEVNEVALSLTGYRRDEVLGRTTEELRLWVRPGDRDFVRNRLLERGQLLGFETAVRGKHDTRLQVLVSAVTTELDGVLCGIFAVVDVTEVRRIQNELQRMQKLESVAVLAGGIAHDFNNLLTAIMGNVSLARLSLSEGVDAEENLAQAEAACRQSKELTTQLLSLSRKQSLAHDPVDVAEVLRESAELSLAGSGTACRWEADDRKPLISGDRTQLSRVFQNLILNASQAMQGAGEIRVRIDHAELEQGVMPSKGNEPAGKGPYVHVAVADNGPGIAPEQLDRIFDPYFTTKDTGTGLGLSVVYLMVQRHGGTVVVDSTPGEGTTFHVYLPATKA